MTPAEIARDLRRLAGEVEKLAPAPPAPPAIVRDIRLLAGHYHPQQYQKDLVVLHFTAGSSVSGAVNHWQTLAAAVGTAYVLDRAGILYEIFDPRCWAHHLGIPGAASENYRHDQRSIGIEIVNVGPLRRFGGALCWWPQTWKAKYCSEDERHLYVEKTFRGEMAWATFTDAQYETLGRFLPALCEEHGIPLTLPEPRLRGEANLAHFSGFRGIAAHQNFRNDKFDVGPAFDWGRLLVTR